jgi:hypothetical protein
MNRKVWHSFKQVKQDIDNGEWYVHALKEGTIGY